MGDVEGSLSIEEVKQRYKDEWVAVRVTERDVAGQPSKVKVVSHNPSRYKLMDTVIEEKEICIIYAGSTPHEGYMVMF